MLKTNVGKISIAYSKFWMRFCAICKKYPRPPNLPLDFKPANGAANEFTMVLKEPIYLRDWPYKAPSSRDVVDIVINAKERINIDNMHIVFSNVAVSYYKSKNSQWHLLESLHYDFDIQIPCHPTFHVQLCDNGVSTPDFVRRRQIERDRIIRYKNIRIPTAHMSLISVLVCIVADHLNSEVLTDLIRETIKINNLPQVDSNRISGILSNQDFRSLHWYPQV
ncbi:MAG: hypothetical protein ISS47_06070 [Candidatus Omnitrophica bacterium]|nr:hypothetical protein [Candidatus Omnitrophota bacterium]